MPGGFPLGLEICNVSVIATTTVSANASANTVGSWVQLTASSAIDCVFIYVRAGGFSNIGPNGAVDIGVGGAGSEVVVLQQLITAFHDTNGVTNSVYLLPTAIPKGSRISARSQVNHASDGLFIDVVLYDGAFTEVEGYAGVDSIGFVAATTLGTSVDPGAVASTKGAYSQLVASTARDYAGLYVAFDCLGQTAGTLTNTDAGQVWIAVGAAGSENDIISGLNFLKFYYATSALGIQPPVLGPFMVPIPSGTRIAAAAEIGTSTVTERLVGVTCYGIYQ